jgi:hypothetical protein
VTDYVRPALPKQLFYDAAGNVIDYGNRWHDRPGRMPPEDTYSVDSHPERFASLHTVADALIEHLRQNYEVTVEEGITFARELLKPPDNVLRAVRITPDNPDGAPLTFVFTSYPGITVHAGLLHDFPLPQCGCDACDETPESIADELESIVLAVVAGGYKESVDPGAELPIGYQLASDTHRRSGHTRIAGYPAERVAASTTQLRILADGWQPWLQRSTT